MQQLIQPMILGNSLLNYLLSVGSLGVGVLLIQFVLKRILLEELRNW